jgi:hypothetical protein
MDFRLVKSRFYAHLLVMLMELLAENRTGGRKTGPPAQAIC